MSGFRGGSVLVALAIALGLAPVVAATFPAASLGLDVTVTPAGSSGVIEVVVTNPLERDVLGIYLESELPDSLAVTADHGAVVGGVWRLSLDRLRAGSAFTAVLAYAEREPLVRPAGVVVSLRAPGMAPLDVRAAVPASPPPPAFVAGILGALALAGVGAALLRLPAAEQVFLVHRSGMLIGSRGRALRDTDLFSGMLVILQHAIRRGLRDPGAVLQEVHFDGRTLALVHGRHSLMAAVIRGSPAPRQVRRFEAALRVFETANRRALRSWDGDPAHLRGIEATLARV